MATSTSFLSLPLEIRCMMYELCSPPDEEWNTAYPWYKPPAELGPMSLLRVCKQIHDEAVPIFYGNKKFDFAFCWNSVRVGGPKSYNDNTKCIPTRYLRMIRACTVYVDPWVGGWPWSSARHVFLAIKARIFAFATRFGGSQHALQELRIAFGCSTMSSNCVVDQARYTYYHPTYRSRRTLEPCQQNMLEPLTEIFNVRRVSVHGVSDDLAGKLERAIICPRKAVTAKEEKYTIRMIKRPYGKRGKRPIKFAESKYHETRLLWDEDSLGESSKKRMAVN